MPGAWSIRLQTSLVVLLFLGSLSTALISAYQTLLLPQGELQERDRLREASRRMAEAAAKLGDVPEDGLLHWSEFNARLRDLSARVLQDYSGVEGGFYVNTTLDRFGGYAFPTGMPGTPPPVVPKGKGGPIPGEYRTVQGIVKEFTRAPRGEVDGVLLSDGTMAHWPSHLQERFTEIVTKGDRVQVVGQMETGPRGDTKLEVSTLTNLPAGRGTHSSTLSWAPWR
jgi:hypothetical protein